MLALRLEQQTETFITFCQVCTGPIAEDRRKKNSRTCSKGCQREYRAARLKERKLRLRDAAARMNGQKPQKSNGISVPEVPNIEVQRRTNGKERETHA
jgi:hypothetical protein